MKKVTAEYLYENFADDEGLIEIKILDDYNWTIKEAEKEGLVIKELYYFNKNTISGEIRHRKKKGVKNDKRIRKKAKIYNKTFWNR